MICPICGFENLQGLDNCANCGSDLRTADIPHPGNEFEDRLVREHLSTLQPRPPVTIPSDMPAGEAIRKMQDREAECLLVHDDGRLVGIFTERDALLKLAGKELDRVTVAEVMTRDPVVLRDHDTMAVAFHKMAVGGFRHIPLVEDGHATGIISARDLFRHVMAILD